MIGVVRIEKLICKYISKNDPNYEEVVALLWQYLRIEAAKSVTDEEQEVITNNMLKVGRRGQIDGEQILESYYPKFYSNVEFFIDKYFKDYV